MNIGNAMNIKIIRNEFLLDAYELKISEEYTKQVNLKKNNFCLLVASNNIERITDDLLEKLVDENDFIISKYVFLVFLIIE